MPSPLPPRSGGADAKSVLLELVPALWGAGLGSCRTMFGVAGIAVIVAGVAAIVAVTVACAAVIAACVASRLHSDYGL